MLETSRKEIRNFANLLRKKLVSAGCHQAYVNSLSDDQILDDYRTCCDCGEEIHSKDQQLRLIIESDTPERAYELLYEIEAPDEQQTETDECLILYNDPEYLDDETCDDCECDEDRQTGYRARYRSSHENPHWLTTRFLSCGPASGNVALAESCRMQ